MNVLFPSLNKSAKAFFGLFAYQSCCNSAFDVKVKCLLQFPLLSLEFSGWSALFHFNRTMAGRTAVSQSGRLHIFSNSGCSTCSRCVSASLHKIGHVYSTFRCSPNSI